MPRRPTQPRRLSRPTPPDRPCPALAPQQPTRAPGPVGRAVAWAGHYVDLDRFASREYLVGRLQAMSGAIAARAMDVIGGAVGVVVEIFFVVFTLFYLFRDGDKLGLAARSLLPLD